MSEQDAPTPTQAHAIETARLLYLVVCSAWTWDAITSFSDEVEIFIGHPITPIDVVYTLSKVSVGSVFYAAFSFAILPSTSESRDCNIGLRAITWLSTFSLILTSLLFLVRANSVYHDYRPARTIFIICWIIKAIGVFCIPFSYTAASVQPRNMCIIASIKELMIIPTFSVALFDTIVFFSISYRTTASYGQDGGWMRCKRFFRGSDTCLGPFSRALLHTGQLYFFPSACLWTCSLVLQFSITSKSLELYQFQLVSYGTFLALTNSLACRVFRMVRLFREEEVSTPSGDVNISAIAFSPFAQEETSTHGSE